MVTHERVDPSRARWIVPLCVLVIWLATATAIRIWFRSHGELPAPVKGNQADGRVIEIAQATLLALACLACVWAMVRTGWRKADFYWWVAPAFICFFMCWREIEIDERYLGAHAFSWNYLISHSHHSTTTSQRLILGIPSLGLSLLVALLCIRHARMLLAALRQRHQRVGLVLFATGIGCYLLAQIYDRGHGLLSRHGIALPGFVAHRDDFWEEALELTGALAIFMAVVAWYRARPAIRGTVTEAREVLARRATVLARAAALTSHETAATAVHATPSPAPSASRDAGPEGESIEEPPGLRRQEPTSAVPRNSR